MTVAKNVDELRKVTAETLSFTAGEVKVLNRKSLIEKDVDTLAWTAAFSADAETRDTAAWLIRSLAQQFGNGPASIHEVYMAIGKGDLPADFTVPAINIRAFAYNFARVIFRAAKKSEVGALICELSRTEMGYTNQTPQEYASSVLAAALREGYPWPVFIQGDHFQINAKSYAADPGKEIAGLERASLEAMAAGFFNIDLDTSTLVDVGKPTLAEEQRLNCESCAALSKYIRDRQPRDVLISLGGEIGEVGKQNSTVEELEAFMDGYNRLIGGITGLSKMSVQTGTSHGGVVLPDGSMAKVKVDFDTLGKLSEACRKKFGMGGAVQHGASTLPLELFDRFPQVGTLEIHLATEFQNILYEHPKFPSELKDEMYAHLKDKCAKERKEGESDAQFYYKTRKKALGPFKSRLWSLPGGALEEISKSLEDRVELLFKKLNVGGTGPKIKGRVKLPQAPVKRAKTGGKAEEFDGAD